MTFTYPAEVIAKKVADRKIAKERIKELETALIATDDALYWLLHLLHGMSKGGPEFGPPSNAEWTGAIGQGKEAHDIAEAALGNVMSQDDIESVITQYKRQFGMTSEEFLQKRQEGTVPDTFEAMEWAILLKYTGGDA